MPSYSTHDDAGQPTRVRWTWLVPLRPDQPSRPWMRLPRYLLPPVVVLFALAAWSLLAWSEGPFVLAVTLFSPISSSLIFALIAMGLWQVRCLSRHAAASRTAMVARRECPGCSYPLSPASEAERSQTTDPSRAPSDPSLSRCPECGGVWNLSPARDTIELVRVCAGTADHAMPLAK